MVDGDVVLDGGDLFCFGIGFLVLVELYLGKVSFI